MKTSRSGVLVVLLVIVAAAASGAQPQLPSSPANVRQILGRPGEVWGAESGVDKLVVFRTR